MRQRPRSAGLAGLALVGLLVAAGYLWQRSGVASSEPDPQQTVRVRRESLDRSVLATGVIRPVVGAEVDVGSRLSGIVLRLPVEVGQRVERGDLLAVLDATELRAEVAQARADLALAEAERLLAGSSQQRALALAAEGVVPTSDLQSAERDLEIARARVEREQARLDSATIRLGYAEIRAPIAGVIADVTTREGETVAASFAAPTFVTIVDLERLEVQAYVDETDVGRIEAGQPATFTVDTYPDAEFAARVTAINPRAELQNGVVNYVVRLELDAREEGVVLRPEMTAHVRLHVDRRGDVLTLPRRAIRHDGDRTFVRVLREGVWIEQPIETGWRTDDRVEILDGLAEGQAVQIDAE